MSMAAISSLALATASPLTPVVVTTNSAVVSNPVEEGMAPSDAEGQSDMPAVPAVPVSPAAPGAVPPNAAIPDEDPLPGAEDDVIVVMGQENVPSDPMADVNLKSYEVVQEVDAAVVAPLAEGYEKAVPDPVRSGLRNFLRNLEEPVIFLNFLLQLKPVSALKTLARFGINSTIGVAGLIDVAKKEPFDLPYRQNSFGNTFACYGIGPGPYLFLPLIGPTTLRDVIGVTMDKALLPAVVGPPLTDPIYTIPAFTIDSLNDRNEMEGEINRIREEEGDPYAVTRDLYLKQRAAEIAATCGNGDEPIDPDLPPRPGKGVD